MQCTTGWRVRQWGEIGHTLAVLGLLLLVGLGISPESQGGWVACPPQGIEIEGKQPKRKRQQDRCQRCDWRAGWDWLRRSWRVAAVRSEALLVLVLLSGYQEWEWLCWLPWIEWLWKGLGVAWPGLGRQAVYRGLGRVWAEASRWALIGLGLVWLSQKLAQGDGYGGYGLALGRVWQQSDSEASIEMEQDEQGVYHVRLRGEFELHVDGNVLFYKRMLAVFLGLLEAPGGTRSSRRTRDGRTPLVRQQQMEAWFGVPQPHISRWMSYWLEQDWRRMLSQKHGEVLTQEVQERVIASWVKFPWWSAQRMWEHQQAQGNRITLKQVQQVGRESGWSSLRQALSRVYVISAESFRPREDWLVSQLLAQLQDSLERLEQLGGLTPQQGVELADLEALCQDLGLSAAITLQPLPWMMQLERLLFGRWELLSDESVRCTYCGSTQVSRKSRKGRLKRYVDEQGKEQSIEVYRYYCHNPACQYKSFTNLPPNLTPHSRWTLNHRLAALQTYAWSRGVYRRSSQVLGLSSMTVYRWVSGFGYQLLPVAALFGVVRSSGVVGIDEKYVLVPKNDKPEAKMKRWMYVYFAVDCYTYDLLHIEIYPYNTKSSARAFLLALRAKGYAPRVIVTDMRVDYSHVVAQVFPKALHHECIFHALQQVHKDIKAIFGSNYAQSHPQAETLKHDIDHIFRARTKRTACRRYAQVMAQRKAFVAETPDADTIFDFLERHWPTLLNSIESRIIPATNNSTEQVIRIFTQHYKTFCGFESFESARCYLAVFEQVYRCTPFSQDAHKRIRGKCPLELAGYEVQKLPLAHLFRGLALQWPAAAFQELVPNV